MVLRARAISRKKQSSAKINASIAEINKSEIGFDRFVCASELKNSVAIRTQISSAHATQSPMAQ